jgi:hypothetical protein
VTSEPPQALTDFASMIRLEATADALLQNGQEQRALTILRGACRAAREAITAGERELGYAAASAFALQLSRIHQGLNQSEEVRSVLMDALDLVPITEPSRTQLLRRLALAEHAAGNIQVADAMRQDAWASALRHGDDALAEELAQPFARTEQTSSPPVSEPVTSSSGIVERESSPGRVRSDRAPKPEARYSFHATRTKR